MNLKNDNINLSIVIVNWNTCKITCDCLRSVYEQTKSISFEVIVIDNASSDDSVAVIKKEFPQVLLIANSENLGFAAANNQGMEIAKGKYVLLLNSDTVVLDHAIEKTIAFADQNPQAGVIGCRILNPDMSLQRSCFMFPSLLNMFIGALYLNKFFPKSKFFGRERMTYWAHDTMREVETVMGAFMLVRKEAIDQVGIMDDSFFMYAEEADWCYRFKKTGWQVLFTPDTKIVHLGGQSSNRVYTKMILQLRAGILQFIRKHHSKAYYFASCFMVSLWFGLRVIPWTIVGLIPSKKQKARQMAKAYVAGAIRATRGYKALTAKN